MADIGHMNGEQVLKSPIVLGLLWRALSYGLGARENREEIKQDITDGRLRVLVAHDEGIILGAAFARKVYPRDLQLFAVAGIKRHEWQRQMNQALIQYAEHLNCDTITTFTRPGGERVLIGLGWYPVARVVEYDVRRRWRWRKNSTRTNDECYRTSRIS